jgi:hypothetical protein
MNGSNDMSPSAAILAGVLAFSEAEYYNPSQQLLAERESQLLDINFDGVAVNAPKVIDTRERGTLPLIMAARFSGDRDWDVPLIDNCLLVASNLNDGRVYFAPALTSRKDVTRAGKLKVPKGEKPEGLAEVSAQVTIIDALSKLPIHWNTGSWALGVINYDRPSNAVTVELKGNDTQPVPTPRPIHPPLPAATDASALPSYIAMGKNPRMLDSGVAFTTEIVESDGQSRLHVYGSFAIPVRDYMLPREETVHDLPSGRRERVAAIVPITFAIIALNSDLPVQVDMAVPIYGGAALRVGGMARGYFAVEVSESSSSALSMHRCYVIVGGDVFGPRLVVESVAR